MDRDLGVYKDYEKSLQFCLGGDGMCFGNNVLNKEGLSIEGKLCLEVMWIRIKGCFWLIRL